MQAVGVGESNAGAGPIGRYRAAQQAQHAADVAGAQQFLTAPLDQQAAQALKHGLMRFALAGQAKQAIDRLALMAQRLLRRDEGQPRLAHRLFAVQPPQAIAQRQRLDLLQAAGEITVDALHPAQQPCALPEQVVEIVGGDAKAKGAFVQQQFPRRALQQVQHRFGAVGAAQGFGHIGVAQGAGELLQEEQVFVGARGNGDRQENPLAIAPVHALRELHQAHAGDVYQVAGLRCTVGNGDALAEKGRALRFAGLQPSQVTFGNQSVAHQVSGQKLQGRGLVHSRLAHGYLRRGELEHDRLLCNAGTASRLLLLR